MGWGETSDTGACIEEADDGAVSTRLSIDVDRVVMPIKAPGKWQYKTSM